MPESQVLATTFRLGGRGPLAALAALVGLGLLHGVGLAALVGQWTDRPEYGHGFVVPVLAALLFVREAGRVAQRGGLVGDAGLLWLPVLLVAAGVAVIGRLAGIPDLESYAFVVVLACLSVVFLGQRSLAYTWPAFVLLFFMVPLPAVINLKLSLLAQLLSSQFGTGMIEALGIPVIRDGNLIDLGVRKLQIAEACNGLRYLFPLMCFGFLLAALTRGPLWKRVVIFLLTIPIAIFMNALRIAVTALMLDVFGSAAAEGVLHYTEGWVVFMLCVIMLFGAAVALIGSFGDPGDRVLDVDYATFGRGYDGLRRLQAPPAAAWAAGIVAVAGAALVALPRPAHTIPSHLPFQSFPAQVGPWTGEHVGLDPSAARLLDADEYIFVRYVEPAEPLPAPVHLFVAYYEQQRTQGIHHPEICIAGVGWEFLAYDTVSLPATAARPALTAKRAVVQKGDATSVVYYWFRQRERVVTNEYLLKYYLLVDAVLRGRTDGALIRVDTPVQRGETVAEAEARLRNLLDDSLPEVDRFLPS